MMRRRIDIALGNAGSREGLRAAPEILGPLNLLTNGGLIGVIRPLGVGMQRLP